MNWTIELLADNKTIKIKESTTGILSIFPINTFSVIHDVSDTGNTYLTLDGTSSNYLFKMVVSEISSPAIGLNSYEDYLSKLGRRLDGDNTVVF